MITLSFSAKKIGGILLILLLPFNIAVADTQTDLKTRCQSALELDMNALQNRQTVEALLNEIKQKKQRYLRSLMYPEMRRLYQELLAKLGNHYFNRDNVKKALPCYIEADKYAVRGYRNKIKTCRENIAEIILREFTKGRDSTYRSFIRDASNEDKIHFQEHFYREINKPGYRQEIEKILIYSGLWKQFKKVKLTGIKNDLYDARRKEMEQIFTSAGVQYKQELEKKMSRLEPVGAGPGEIVRYTGDKDFAKKVENYVVDYHAFRQIMPPGKKDMEKANDLFEKLEDSISINDAIKNNFKSYMEGWREYYQVEDGDSYLQKGVASHKKGDILKQIKQSINHLKVLNFNAHNNKMDEMIDQAEADESKWRIHMETKIVIDDFEKKTNPTLADLYKIRKALFYAPESAAFEGPLLERVRQFLAIPSPGKLDLERLEHYLDTNRNLESNITKVLKKEFEARLLARLERLLKKSSRSLKDRADIKKYTVKYEAYFGKKPPGFSKSPRSTPGENKKKETDRKKIGEDQQKRG